MKLKQIVQAVTSLAVGVVLASTAMAQTVSIGTTPSGSSINALGSALGKVVSQKTGLQVRVIPFGGVDQYGPKVDSGKLDMGITSATDVRFALAGKAHFKGRSLSNLRAVASLYSFYLGFLVRKDSDIQKVTDLKGRPVPTTFAAMKVAHRHYLAALWAHGMTEKDVKGVPVPHVVRAAQDFAQGKTVATWFAVGAGKVSEIDAQVGGIRFLSMDDSPEALARMREIAPAAYVTELLPKSRLTGIVGPTKVMTEDYMLVAGAHVPGDVVYKFAKTLYEEKESLSKTFAAWRRYDPRKLAKNLGVSYHPGAIKFFQEKGMWPPKK